MMEQQVVPCLGRTGPRVSDSEGCGLSQSNPLFQVFPVSWYVLKSLFMKLQSCERIATHGKLISSKLVSE